MSDIANPPPTSKNIKETREEGEVSTAALDILKDGSSKPTKFPDGSVFECASHVSV